MRLPLLLLALTCAPLAFAGCMQSSKDRFIADYQPLNDRLVSVNGKLVKTLNTPSSPDKLATELTPLSGELTRLSRQISDLDTPEDLRQESGALSRTLARTGAGADTAATAAREADRRALVNATKALADDVNRGIRQADRLARAAG
jgi:hypothetical protein